MSGQALVDHPPIRKPIVGIHPGNHDKYRQKQTKYRECQTHGEESPVSAQTHSIPFPSGPSPALRSPNLTILAYVTRKLARADRLKNPAEVFLEKELNSNQFLRTSHLPALSAVTSEPVLPYFNRLMRQLPRYRTRHDYKTLQNIALFTATRRARVLLRHPPRQFVEFLSDKKCK